MDKKGIGTIPIILITMVTTLMMTFVGYKIWSYTQVLENGVNYASTYMNPSSGSQVSNSKTISPTIQNKITNLKRIIDEAYLYEYEEDKMADNMAAGMLKALDDPYAEYYNAEAFEAFYTQTEGEYFGIGVYVSYDESRKLPIILATIEGSPAEAAGLLPADYIEYVDDLNSYEHTYTEVVDAIKGASGSKVKLGIIRKNKETKEEEAIEIEVERRKIEINPVKSEIYENSIGYIKLTSFDESTYEHFATEYSKHINNPNIRSLIIDLRDNPGGVLDSCVKISDLILPEGKIFYTKDKAGREEALYSNPNAIRIPLVVLVNGNSASASEVFTAAVKDYKVGIIIGKTTYGKGVVQTLLSLRDGSFVKFTTSEYFSPNGNKINGIGVVPDIEVDLPDGITNTYKLEFKDDTQLQKAIEVLRGK